MKNLQTKADVLNKYFVQQWSTVTNSSSLPNFQPTCNALLQSLDKDKEKITALICALDTTRAHGCEDISTSMINIYDTSIVEQLCLIFGKCLETEIYPFLWKKVNISFTKDNAGRANKSTIKFLCWQFFKFSIFEKIFKGLIFVVLYCLLCDHGLITPHRSGFRPVDSTINHLLSITHKMFSAFWDIPSKETRDVFLDLSKAFDRVWHERLHFKLKCSGVSGDLSILIRNI